MKKFIWLACLAVLLASLITSCGSLRISSINARDDSALEAEVEHNDLGVRSRRADVEKKEFFNEVDRQVFASNTSTNSSTDTDGWAKILVVNRNQNRQVTYLVKVGDRVFRRYTLKSLTQLTRYLPIGRYRVELVEYTVKKISVEDSWDLDVTNELVESGSYGDFNAIITN